jgi:hypothetical protein
MARSGSLGDLPSLTVTRKWFGRLLSLAPFVCTFTFAQDAQEGLLDRIDAGVIVDVRATVETGDPEFQSSEIRFQPELDIHLWKNANLRAVARFRADAFDKLEAGIPTQRAIGPLPIRPPTPTGTASTIRRRRPWTPPSTA